MKITRVGQVIDMLKEFDQNAPFDVAEMLDDTSVRFFDVREPYLAKSGTVRLLVRASEVSTEDGLVTDVH